MHSLSPSWSMSPHGTLCAWFSDLSDLLISSTLLPSSPSHRAWFVGVIGTTVPGHQQGALVLMLLLPLSTQAGHDFSYCFEIRIRKSLFFSPFLCINYHMWSTDIQFGIDTKMNETGPCDQEV